MPTPSVEYPTIPLSQGQSAIVSVEDYERVSAYRWYAHWSPSSKSFYAVRKGPRNKGQGKMVWMHRFILGCEFGDGKIIDHVNNNSLDNRRENLRAATRAENGQNRKYRSSTKGTTYNRKLKKWVAQISVNNQHIHLGVFATQEEAHSSYCAAARQYHKDYASF